MKTYLAKIAVLVLVLLTTTSCATLFSSSKTTAKSPWREFAEAKAAYDRVEAGRTSVGQMRELGFDPYASQNLKVLNYLEVLNRFIPNNSVRVEDLPLAVRTFLAAQEKAVAYELEVTAIRGQRYGNLCLDILGFNRKTHETGWNFKALFLIHEERVVYKLWSAQPNIDRHEQKKKPLGPLQEIDLNLAIPTIK